VPELKILVIPACLVTISPRRSPSEKASLPMMLIWRTLDLGPSDFEHDIDAVLVEHDHLRFDRSGEAALPLVQFDDPGDVGANLGPGEDLARRQLDLGEDLVRP
jgi:hypothetical protein